MHIFRPSRGRVLFEVFCALAIAASFAGGWIQTGAWALLPAAIVAALYGLVHAFDPTGRSSAFSAADGALDLKTVNQRAGTPLSASDEQLEPVDVIERVKLLEPEAPPARKVRKTKAPRKVRAPDKATEDGKVTKPAPPREEVVSLVGFPEEEEGTSAEHPGDVTHIQLTPLFEPEPFVRQQRTVFGRKAG